PPRQRHPRGRIPAPAALRRLHRHLRLLANLPHQPVAQHHEGEDMAAQPAHRGLTAQQEAAVTRRESSVVLSSGAGCGKTTVLTQRYLSHLIANEAAVGEIVAITFTDRAAREMRGRIRRAVVERLDAAATDEETARWERHLRDLETAQICT